MKNYYDILHLKRTESSRKIRKKTLALGKNLHPSFQNPTNTNNRERFIDVIEAYEMLCDEETRMIYDLLLANEGN